MDALLDGLSDARGPVPVFVTLSGDVARSFSNDTSMTTTVAGLGTMTASTDKQTWGEYGASAQAQVTQYLAVDLDLNGTIFHHSRIAAYSKTPPLINKDLQDRAPANLYLKKSRHCPSQQ